MIESVKSFLEILAKVRELFRKAEIELSKGGDLKNIRVTVSPFKTGKNPSLTFFLDGDLANSCDSASPIGLSVKIEALDEVWLLEDYIHFPNGNLDWFDYEEHEERYTSVEDLLDSLPTFAERALKLYKDIVAG